MDEPASGLSPEETRDMRFRIDDIRWRMGITVVMVEHDMGVVTAVSDRVPVLADGRAVTPGIPAEVKSHPKVIEAYPGADAGPAYRAFFGVSGESEEFSWHADKNRFIDPARVAARRCIAAQVPHTDSSDDQTVRPAQVRNLTRHRPEQHSFRRAQSPGAQHDEIAISPRRLRNDSSSRIALPDV